MSDTRLEPLAPEFMNAYAQSEHVTGAVAQLYADGESILRLAHEPFDMPSKAGGVGDEKAPLLLAIFRRGLVLRTAELLPIAIESLNRSRLLGCAMATRGILETAAAGAYYASRLELPSGQTTLPAGYDGRLIGAVFGARFDSLKFSSSPSSLTDMLAAYDAAPKKQSPRIRSTNVLTMIEALARRAARLKEPLGKGVIQFNYAFLSDHTHPSLSGHLVYLTEKDGTLSMNLKPNDASWRSTGSMAVVCLYYSLGHLIEILSELENLESRVRKLSERVAPEA